jgi:hypothetical protein
MSEIASAAYRASVLAWLKRNKLSGTLVPFLHNLTDGVMVKEERPPNELLLSFVKAFGALHFVEDTKDAIDIWLSSVSVMESQSSINS